MKQAYFVVNFVVAVVLTVVAFFAGNGLYAIVETLPAAAVIAAPIIFTSAVALGLAAANAARGLQFVIWSLMFKASMKRINRAATGTRRQFKAVSPAPRNHVEWVIEWLSSTESHKAYGRQDIPLGNMRLS